MRVERLQCVLRNLQRLSCLQNFGSKFLRLLTGGFEYVKLVALSNMGEQCDPADRYYDFHRLRLACKHFQRAFDEHAELSSCIFLDQDFSTQALSSLLYWLQRTESSIASFVAACGSPLTEAVLAGAATAFKRPLNQVSTVVLRDASTVAVSLLVACTNLSRCYLMGMSDADLSCLRLLPRLRSLEMVSMFGITGIELVPRLTHLEVDCAELDCSSNAVFASSLKILSGNSSTIYGFHDLGIFACSLLQQLKLNV